MVFTAVHSPLPETDGSSISNVRRVPVGRKLTSIEVFESVFCIPFAIARLFRPPLGWSVQEEDGSFGGVAV